MASDLTAQEQEYVRIAIRCLRWKLGTWELVAKALRFERKTIRQVRGGKYAVSARLMLRVARLVNVSMDDLLSGKYPPSGTCPHCGFGATQQDGPAGR
jgi:DNA-binding XRE family transcriptional regulator